MVGLFNRPSKILSYVKNLFLPKETGPATEKIYSKRLNELSARKQAELEALCEQLFTKKELITSGKMQFIGLAKIKKQLGKRWGGLQGVVFETAEKVISEYIDKNDLFIRYKEDVYVIVFADADIASGEYKTLLIATEIHRRLFEIDEEFKNLEIKTEANEIKTSLLSGRKLNGVAEKIATAPPRKAAPPIDLSKINAIEVEGKVKAPPPPPPKPEPLMDCIYVPIWDVQSKALSTYLCLPTPSSQKSTFSSYSSLYSNQTHSAAVEFDKKMFKRVKDELDSMIASGRQVSILCPVHYETLYREDSFHAFAALCQSITPEQKKYLNFLIANVSGKLPQRTPYWFLSALKVYCRHVFVEMPINTNAVHLPNDPLIDAVGILADTTLHTESNLIKFLNTFGAKARDQKAPKTFILGVTSLSLTTSAICAGFHYLGGTAIHDNVKHPDNIYRYKNEDLVSALIPKD